MVLRIEPIDMYVTKNLNSGIPVSSVKECISTKDLSEISTNVYKRCFDI